MNLLTSINEQRVTRLSVRVPSSGVWLVEGDFDQALSDADLVGSARVNIGPLSLLGTFDPDRTGTYLQQSKCRILGGSGGWRGNVGARQYHDDGLGVRALDVIVDLAREAGEETLGTVTPPVERLGADFIRRAGRAKDMLSIVVGRSWWVDYDGKTQIGVRPQSEVVGQYEILEFDPRFQVATIATDDPRIISIGSVLRDRLDAPRVVREITIEAGDGKIRMSCWCPDLAAADPRLFGLISAYVRAALPELPYYGTYRYRVISENSGDQRWKLQAVAAAEKLPNIEPASVHPGVAGMIAELPGSSVVLVQFVEGNPALPIITHFAAPDEPGFVPVSLTLCAGATGAYPNEHATSAEALVNLVSQVVTLLGPRVAPPLLPADAVALVKLAIAAAGLGTVSMYSMEIAAALAAKVPDPTGVAGLASIGWPDVRGA